MQGWIKLHRKLLDNQIWLSEPFTRAQAWIDLIFLARYESTPTVIFIRGNRITINRGQLAWSEDALAKRWKWSRNKTRGYIKHLILVQQIEQQKTPAITLLTIVNYDEYQQQTEHRTEQQKDNRKTTESTLNKKEEEGKEGKELKEKNNNLTVIKKEKSKTSLLQNWLDENQLKGLHKDWVTWCREQYNWSNQRIQEVGREFYLYWTSEDCKNPRKRNWYQTWQMWTLRESKKGDNYGNNRRNNKPQSYKEAAEQFLAEIERTYED